MESQNFSTNSNSKGRGTENKYSKMILLKLSTSIVTINVNGLNTQQKDRNYQIGFLKKTQLYAV